MPASDQSSVQCFVFTVHGQLGETREQYVSGTDPVDAMQRVLRRRWVAEWLLTEQTFAFTLRDLDPRRV